MYVFLQSLLKTLFCFTDQPRKSNKSATRSTWKLKTKKCSHLFCLKGRRFSCLRSLSGHPGEVPPSLGVLPDEGLSLGEAVGLDAAGRAERHTERQISAAARRPRRDGRSRSDWRTHCVAVGSPEPVHDRTAGRGRGDEDSLSWGTELDFVVRWCPVNRMFFLISIQSLDSTDGTGLCSVWRLGEGQSIFWRLKNR